MSQHPSLRTNSAGKKHRNVLKRYERIEKLQDAGRFADENEKAYGLPKVKSQKLKAKGSKTAKKEEEEKK